MEYNVNEINNKITNITTNYNNISKLVKSRRNIINNAKTNTTNNTEINNKITELQSQINKTKQELDMLLAAGNPGGDGDPNQSNTTTYNVPPPQPPSQTGGSRRSKRKSSKKQKKGKTHKRKH